MSAIEDSMFIVCQQVADDPTPPREDASTTNCDACDAACWIAPSSFIPAMHVPLVCNRCMVEILLLEEPEKGQALVTTMKDLNTKMGGPLFES